MNLKELKRLSVSHLILIILNEKEQDSLRKNAEIELKQRIKHLGWDYDDLLHLDDRVIKLRGYDIKNYLLSSDVNMQQLMETYFKYASDKLYDNDLLFSEKHLCNIMGFGEPFFRNVVDEEIVNINERIRKLNYAKDHSEARRMLEAANGKLKRRQEYERESIKEWIKNRVLCDLICCGNEAIDQLDKFVMGEMFDYASYYHGLNDDALDGLFAEYLRALRFVQKDSAKLSAQKKQLLYQVGRGYEVNYESDAFKQSLLDNNENINDFYDKGPQLVMKK